jgi:hypothetical protein
MASLTSLRLRFTLDSTARRPAAAATVFPEVIRQPAKSFVLRGVVVERSLEPGGEKARFHELLQVMAEGGCGEVHLRLDVPGCGAAVPALHDETEGREPYWMPERGELVGVAFQLRHSTTSNYLELAVKC